MKSAKILIYGFMPYNREKQNISEETVKKITSRKKLAKIIFKVNFDRQNFIEKIKKIDPDIIIGLGQHPHGKKIRIERKAVNLRAKNKHETPKIILPKSPRSLSVNLKLNPDKNSRISYDAGKYVCNFSMYMIAAFFKDKKFAFLHLPKTLNLKTAVNYIEKTLEALSD